MLIIGQNHEISFKVNVIGTSAEPSARLVLGSSPELSFLARRTDDGWFADMRIPIGMQPGEYPLRVEVVVNNRHFVPLTKQVELGHALPTAVEQPASISAAPPEVAPQPSPEVETASPTISFQVPAAPGAADAKAFAGIFKDLAVKEAVPSAPTVPAEPPPVPEMRALARAATTPLPKLRARPVKTESKAAPLDEPIKVKLSDVAKLVEEKEQVQPKQRQKAAARVVTIESKMPVKLIKGPIVYE